MSSTAVYPSTEEMLAWNDRSSLDFADHMIAWSRVDYILGQGKKTSRKMLLGLMRRFPGARSGLGKR